MKKFKKWGFIENSKNVLTKFKTKRVINNFEFKLDFNENLFTYNEAIKWKKISIMKDSDFLIKRYQFDTNGLFIRTHYLNKFYQILNVC